MCSLKSIAVFSVSVDFLHRDNRQMQLVLFTATTDPYGSCDCPLEETFLPYKLKASYQQKRDLSSVCSVVVKWVKTMMLLNFSWICNDDRFFNTIARIAFFDT